jgi:hypothetical protein
MLFLLGTGTLIAASVARDSSEVLTAVALIASAIPIFAGLGLLRGRGRESSRSEQGDLATPHTPLSPTAQDSETKPPK